MSHLLLQLEDTEHESFGGWGATWNVDIHGHNSVTPSCNRVRVMVVAASVRAAAHADDPSGVRHLIVDLSQGWCHLVGQRSGHDHHITLARRSSENYTQPILIVSWSGKMHHLDGTAGQSKSHGPKGALSGPVGNLVERRQGILCETLLRLLTGQWYFASQSTGNR